MKPEKILLAIFILFMILVAVSLVYLFYALMNIDVIYNLKGGDIQHVVDELSKHSIRIMPFLIAFTIIFLVAITMLFASLIVLGKIS
jgi:hypothetical protein